MLQTEEDHLQNRYHLQFLRSGAENCSHTCHRCHLWWQDAQPSVAMQDE